MIANTIKQLRTARKVTQEDLAREVKVSRQTIIAIEKGNYTPSLLLAMELSKYFKVQVEELFHIKNTTK